MKILDILHRVLEAGRELGDHELRHLRKRLVVAREDARLGWDTALRRTIENEELKVQVLREVENRKAAETVTAEMERRVRELQSFKDQLADQDATGYPNGPSAQAVVAELLNLRAFHTDISNGMGMDRFHGYPNGPSARDVLDGVADMRRMLDAITPGLYTIQDAASYARRFEHAQHRIGKQRAALARLYEQHGEPADEEAQRLEVARDVMLLRWAQRTLGLSDEPTNAEVRLALMRKSGGAMEHEGAIAAGVKNLDADLTVWQTKIKALEEERDQLAGKLARLEALMGCSESELSEVLGRRQGESYVVAAKRSFVDAAKRVAHALNDSKQAALETWGKFGADLFPDVRATGDALEHAQSCTRQIANIILKERFDMAEAREVVSHRVDTPIVLKLGDRYDIEVNDPRGDGAGVWKISDAIVTKIAGGTRSVVPGGERGDFVIDFGSIGYELRVQPDPVQKILAASEVRSKKAQRYAVIMTAAQSRELLSGARMFLHGNGCTDAVWTENDDGGCSCGGILVDLVFLGIADGDYLHRHSK